MQRRQRILNLIRARYIGQFLDSPGSGFFQCAVTLRLEAPLLFARHVLRIVEPVIFAALQILIASSHQRFVLLVMHLVNSLVEILGNMKFMGLSGSRKRYKHLNGRSFV